MFQPCGLDLGFRVRIDHRHTMLKGMNLPKSSLLA
jgi:hypothetical protein